MKYKAGSRRRAAEYEKALVEWWKKHKVFEKSVEQRPEDDSYVFYDGPPFITGMPHHGTLLSSIVKDAVPRFWTMRGKRVERRWGWDCHGLPAENFVEKQLGITDRREIGTKWSLEDYILKARESMVANSETWEGTIDRIGRWVDFKGAYRTMDKNFMESVWWAFKTLYEAGKIYEGAKVLMYDTKFATPVSKSEVTMDNDAYQEVTDPSAFVKFRLADASILFETVDVTSGHQKSVSSRKSSADGTALTFAKQISDEPGASNASQKTDASADQALTKADEYGNSVYFLAWTTTPWTLPGNMALAVNPEMKYAAYDAGEGRVFVVLESKAEELQKKLEQEWQKLAEFKGEKLVGMKYEALEVGAGTKLVDWKKFAKNYYPARDENAYKVWGAEFVSDGDGTGIVHIAPAYGEDDYELGKKNGVPCIDLLDEYGCYLAGATEGLEAAGVRPNEDGQIQIWEANKFIAKCLEANGPIEKIEYIKHEYPFNPRSKQRIMYRAFPSWFFDVQGQKELMIAQNENINWFPEYLKHGRFEKNIEQAPDWNLSRDRFWATAMPVWKGDKGSVKVVGSYDELYELSGVRLEDYHRPWVDEIEFEIDGEHFKRIDKVLDCWFESGSMPFAQLHYPFENKEKFERNYPADFIVEYVGQVRAWFYYIHVVNTALASIGAFDTDASALSKIKLDKNVKILFICHANMSRSQAAKALYNNFTHSNSAESAGLDVDRQPGETVAVRSKIWAKKIGISDYRPKAQDILLEKFNINIANEPRMQVTPEMLKDYDLVVNVAEKSQTPDWLRGKNVIWWNVKDPGLAAPEQKEKVTQEALAEIERRVRALIDGMIIDDKIDGKTGNIGRQLNAFKNVITTGTLAGNDGRKMSKSLGNYTDPNELMDKFSADALRFLLLSSPVLSGEDFALTDKDVGDVNRKLMMIWNVYDFFTTYAEVDGWEWSDSFSPRISSSEPASAPSPDAESGSVRSSTLPRTSSEITSSDSSEVVKIGDLKNPLDKWIVSRVHELRDEVTAGMEEYNIPRALSGVLPFVDDLSNWFVRRSRRRFWKSEDDGDKAEAYRTLHYVMVKLALILAPFTPFLAEELWQNLVGGGDPENSVHLKDWPAAKEVDRKILAEMARAREVINEGLRLRMYKDEHEEQVKVRQPLAKLVYTGEELPEWGAEIVKEEVNVKAVERGEESWIDKRITEELGREGWARELVRAVQSARKKAGLVVDDRIKLSVGGAEIPEEWREMIKNETLAEELTTEGNYAYDEVVKIGGDNCTISLEKA